MGGAYKQWGLIIVIMHGTDITRAKIDTALSYLWKMCPLIDLNYKDKERQSGKKMNYVKESLNKWLQITKIYKNNSCINCLSLVEDKPPCDDTLGHLLSTFVWLVIVSSTLQAEPSMMWHIDDISENNTQFILNLIPSHCVLESHNKFALGIFFHD